MIPTFLQSFSNTDLQNLYTVGNITPTIDIYGNLDLLTNSNTISSSVIGIQLEKKIYDPNLISLIYPNNNFTEFVENTNQTSQSIDVLGLQQQIGYLTAQLEMTGSLLNTISSWKDQYTGDQSLIAAQAYEIINLKIMMGQGSSSADFESTYPYRPIVSLPYLTSSLLNS